MTTQKELFKQINKYAGDLAIQFNEEKFYGERCCRINEKIKNLIKQHEIRNYFELSITYDIVTEESAQEGDTAENGFVSIEYFDDSLPSLSYIYDRIKDFNYIETSDSFEGGYLIGSHEEDLYNGNVTTEYLHLKLNDHDIDVKHFFDHLEDFITFIEESVDINYTFFDRESIST